MGELTLMQKFADPALIQQLSAVEKTTGALVTTLMGMGITFIVLSLLWGLIALMTKILDKKDQRNLKSVVASEGMAGAVMPSAPQKQTANGGQEDETELIAVITAALAASLNQPASGLVLSKIRRVSGHSIAWSQAGSSDSIASRKF